MHAPFDIVGKAMYAQGHVESGPCVYGRRGTEYCNSGRDGPGLGLRVRFGGRLPDRAKPVFVLVLVLVWRYSIQVVHRARRGRVRRYPLVERLIHSGPRRGPSATKRTNEHFPLPPPEEGGLGTGHLKGPPVRRGADETKVTPYRPDTKYKGTAFCGRTGGIRVVVQLAGWLAGSTHSLVPC